MTAGINHFIFISAVLFGLGLYSIIANRNFIKILFGIILIFTASFINFTAFSNFKWFNPEGQIIIFILSAMCFLLVLTGCVLGYIYYKEFKSSELDKNTGQ